MSKALKTEVTNKGQKYCLNKQPLNDTHSNDANMDYSYFYKHRIILEEYPWSDVPDLETPDYMYFKNGTRQYIRVLNPGTKLYNTKSFYCAMGRLKYLNPNIEYDIFYRCGRILGEKQNNFAIFTLSDQTIQSICKKIFDYEDNFTPNIKQRKLIFKPGNKLTLKEKQSIIGSLCGGLGGKVSGQNARKVDSSDIYEAMLELNDRGEKITNAKLVEMLSVTKRTIQRNKTDELKNEILILNSNLNM
mgnify:FL=1